MKLIPLSALILTCAAPAFADDKTDTTSKITWETAEIDISKGFTWEDADIDNTKGVITWEDAEIDVAPSK